MTDNWKDLTEDQRNAQLLQSGMLTDAAAGRLKNQLTNGQWGNGSATVPRWVNPADKEKLQPNEAPRIDAWRAEWQKDPANKNLAGPNGEVLPERAIGWGYNGQAFFGEGLSGFWQATLQRFDDIDKPIRLSEYEISQRRLEKLGAAGADVSGEEASGSTEETETKPTAFGLVANTVGAVLGTALDAFTLLEKGTKEVVGTPLMFTREYVEAVRDKYDITNIEAAIPGLVAGALLREAFDPNEELGLDAKTVWDESHEASRILYTNISDQVVKQEFLRRLRNGEDPIYLAQELENPWAELIGGLIVDPLNLIGIWGKAATVARKIGAVEDTFTAADKVADAFKAVRTLDKTADAAEYARATERVVSEIVAEALPIINKNGKASKRYGLLAHTTSTTREITMEMLDPQIKQLLAHAKEAQISPDDFGEILDAARLLASGDAAKTAEGLSVMRHFGAPDIMLSEASLTLGHMLNTLDDPAALISSINKAKTPEAAADLIFGTVQKAVDSFFPTVAERLARGEKVDAIARITAGALNTKAADVIKKPFSYVYLGYSPGYAWRNLMTNTVGVMVDFGVSRGLRAGVDSVRSIWSSPTAVLDDTVAMLGFLPRSLTKGGGGSFGEIESVTGLMSVADDIKAAGGWAKWLAKAPSARVSQVMEQVASAHVVNASVRRTLSKLLKPGRMIPDTRELIAAGMKADEATLLNNLVASSFGDVDKAIAKFAEAKSRGFFERWRLLDNVIDDPKDLDFLRGAGNSNGIRVDGEIDEALQLATRDEVLARIDEIRQDQVDRAMLSLKEHGLADGGFVNDQLSADLISADGVFKEDEVAHIVLRNKYKLTDDAQGLYRQAVSDAETMFQLGAKVDPQLNTVMLELQDEFRGLVRNEEFLRVRGETDKARQAITRLAYDGPGVLDNSARNITGKRRDFINKVYGSHEEAWRKLLESEPPVDLDTPALFRALWEDYFAKADSTWSQYLNYTDKMTTQYMAKIEAALSGSKLAKSYKLDKAKENLGLAQQAMNAAAELRGKQSQVVDGVLYLMDDIIDLAETQPKNALQRLGFEYGINNEPRLLNTVNKYSEAKFEKVGDIPFEVGRAALEARAAEKGIDVLQSVRGSAFMPSTNGQPTTAQAWLGNLPDINRIFDNLVTNVNKQWGQLDTMDGTLDPALFAKWKNTAKERQITARAIAAKVADADRDFALVGYDKRFNLDIAASFIWPWGFWQSRQVSNWAQRAISHPEVIAAYAKWKEAMADAHADMPPWWKYNVSTDLFGLSENPLFFNLEAMFNPLHQVTQTDFNDVNKRVNGWTRMLDEAGKIGASVNPLFSIMTAYALYTEGRKNQDPELLDAAARWGGRLIPQTQVLKSATHLLGIGEATPFGTAAGIELDPLVNILGGGMTPYERQRVARALAQLVAENPQNRAEILDQARSQSGEWWDEATSKAAYTRDYSNLASWMFGVGAKGRSIEEKDMDLALNDWYSFWRTAENLSPDEKRRALRAIHEKWPQLEVVLLARKDSTDRDISFAYNVISRLPPGENIAELAGIPNELINQFYENPRIDRWTEGDRNRFLAAILDAAAILEIPPDATRAEWNAAKDANAALWTQIETTFGKDIQVKIDTYFAIRQPRTDEAYTEAEAFLRQFPEIGQALDYRSEQIFNTPALSTYYGGIDKIEQYYEGKIRGQLGEQLGEGVFDTLNEYWELRNSGNSTAASAFYRNHPEIKRYYSLRDELRTEVSSTIVQLGLKLDEPVLPELRENEELGVGQQLVADNLAGLETQQVIPLDVWKRALGDAVYGQVLDLVYSGQALDTFAANAIEQFAAQNGLTTQEVIDGINTSINQ